MYNTNYSTGNLQGDNSNYKAVEIELNTKISIAVEFIPIKSPI